VPLDRHAAVIANDGANADALATCACVLDLDAARALIAATPGASARITHGKQTITVGNWPGS
jgi:thiamine biosynthesis lipoprotein ApbE